jgi:hypothetical protein
MAKVSLASLVATDDDDLSTKTPARTSPPEAESSVTVTNEAAPEAHVSAPRRQTRRRPVKKIATVYTTDAVFRQLREYVANRKARGEILTYGVASLLAVQAHRDELATLWTEAGGEAPDEGTSEEDDLFGVTVRKAAPKKVPWQLHGASPAQVQLLDDLVEQWCAPSRSVLVEEALVRYLAPAPRAKRVSRAAPAGGR